MTTGREEADRIAAQAEALRRSLTAWLKIADESDDEARRLVSRMASVLQGLGAALPRFAADPGCKRNEARLTFWLGRAVDLMRETQR